MELQWTPAPSGWRQDSQTRCCGWKHSALVGTHRSAEQSVADPLSEGLISSQSPVSTWAGRVLAHATRTAGVLGLGLAFAVLGLSLGLACAGHVLRHSAVSPAYFSKIRFKRMELVTYLTPCTKISGTVIRNLNAGAKATASLWDSHAPWPVLPATQRQSREGPEAPGSCVLGEEGGRPQHRAQHPLDTAGSKPKGSRAEDFQEDKWTASKPGCWWPGRCRLCPYGATPRPQGRLSVGGRRWPLPSAGGMHRATPGLPGSLAESCGSPCKLLLATGQEN